MKKLTIVSLVLVLIGALIFTGCTASPAGNGDTSSSVSSDTVPTADSSAPAETSAVTSAVAPSESSAPDATTAPVVTTAPEATTAPAGNLYTYDHVTIALPEGFTMTEVNGNPVALCPGYPTRTDNIAFSKGGADSIDNYTRDLLDSIYAQSVPGFVNSVGFEKVVIDGKPAVLYAVTAVQNNINMEMLQVIIFGAAYSDVVTFVSVSGDFEDAFEAAINSISVKD